MKPDSQLVGDLQQFQQQLRTSSEQTASIGELYITSAVVSVL